MEKTQYQSSLIFLFMILSLLFLSDGFTIKKNCTNLLSRVVKKSEIPLAVWVEGMNGKSFTITPMKSGFYESSDTCESFGSYLATILDINDQKTISETIKNVKAQNEIFFWIGMTVEGQRDWTWRNKTFIATGFLNWSPGQPSSSNALQDCGAVGQDGKWFSIPCDEKHHGICERIDNKEILMNSIAAGIAISNIPPKISKAASFLLNGSKSENETKTGNETKQENEKSMKPGNMGQQQVNLEKQNNKGKQMRFSNEAKCSLINFINNYGRPIVISRTANNGSKKEFVIEGKSYKLNTFFKKVENVDKMEPVVYSAKDGKDDKKLLLEERDSFTLMPGDCDGDYIDVIVSSPRPIKGLILQDNRGDEKSGSGNEEKNKGDNSKKRCKVETFGGNSEELCCHFPFKLNGRMYYDCTFFDKKHLWCGTTNDYDNDGKWGYCCQGDCN